jgi:hypothetical protein
MRKPDDARAFWQSATRRLAREINVGWWLADWLPQAAAIGLAGMVVMLAVRWRAADAAPWVWCAIAAALLSASVAAWLRARKRFESEEAARVRLEETLGMHARLTTAAAGVGDWPARPSPEDTRWPVTWKWERPAAAVACIAAMLGLAAWVPIAGASSSRKHVIEKPTDARIVEQWIEELEAAELIDERSADHVEKKIKELTERPAEEWYEHASLEAAGTLKEQTASEMRSLADNVAAAERAAAALQSMHESLPQPLRESLVKELAMAIKGLEIGAIQPAGDLAKLLGELQPADLGQLSPEQLAALAKRLATNRAALHAAIAKCKGFNLADVDGWCEACSGCEPCGECEGCKDGKACRKRCSKCGRCADGLTSRGGISRGRGDAELSFGEANDLGTTRAEKMQQAIDAARAAPDEVLAVVDGDHEVDESAYTGPKAGGGIAGEGDGGSAVQIDALLPAEQSAVKRFFE